MLAKNSGNLWCFSLRLVHIPTSLPSSTGADIIRLGKSSHKKTNNLAAGGELLIWE